MFFFTIYVFPSEAYLRLFMWDSISASLFAPELTSNSLSWISYR